MTMLFALLLALTDWAAVVPSIVKSVPRVEIAKNGQQGVCSAVVFEIDKDGYAHALTAGHCVYRASDAERIDIAVNGRTAVTTHSNSILDLAVLKYRAKDDVPIVLAPDMPIAGTEVAIVGYAFGVDEVVVQFGHIAQKYNRESKTTWINADLIFGDSGGSAVDGQGRLVGINSAIYAQGPAHIGAVVTVDAIANYLEAYRAELKKLEERRR